jgi:hypothetical protein
MQVKLYNFQEEEHFKTLSDSIYILQETKQVGRGYKGEWWRG